LELPQFKLFWGAVGGRYYIEEKLFAGLRGFSADWFGKAA
jgi:hypothetical protein